jgi:hypothetical protein
VSVVTLVVSWPLVLLSVTVTSALGALSTPKAGPARHATLFARYLTHRDPRCRAKAAANLRAGNARLAGEIALELQRIRKDLVSCLEKASQASEVDGCLK